MILVFVSKKKWQKNKGHIKWVMNTASAKTQRLRKNDDLANCKLMVMNKYRVCGCRVGSDSEK